MAQLVVTARARADLARLQFVNRLPSDTWQRVHRSIRHLELAPLAGQSLSGQGGDRYVVGPWRWLVIQYRYDDHADIVVLVAIHDARSEKTPLP